MFIKRPGEGAGDGECVREGEGVSEGEEGGGERMWNFQMTTTFADIHTYAGVCV